MRNGIFPTSVFFAVVVAIFIAFMLMTHVAIVPVHSAQELSEADAAEELLYLSDKCFEWYPRALYTPADFASGNVEGPAADPEPAAPYHTYRVILSLTPGRTYGLSGYSATYSQALWIDGEPYAAAGIPGDSVETTVLKTNYYTVYFEPHDSQTEIIIQRADFNHANGGRLYPLYLGAQEKVTTLVASIQLRGGLVVGCMMMACLFFFCIYLFFHSRPYFLWFAISCLMGVIRTLCVDHKMIMILFPDMSWQLSHRLEYLATLGFLLFFFLYVNSLFGWRLPRVVNLFGLIPSCVYLVLVVFFPSIIYTRFLPLMQACMLIYSLCVLLLIGHFLKRDEEDLRREHLLIMAGGIGYMALIFVDVLRYGRAVDLNLAELGMLLFIFANALALSQSFLRTEADLFQARQNEREMEETNKLLEKLNLLRANFLANITHELKTPLTVMSGYAQLTQWQIDYEMVDQGTRENLSVISQEAQRLSSLVSELLTVSLEQERGIGNESLQVTELLDRAAALCTPILHTRGNALVIHVTEDCPPVWGNPALILQVFLNLTTNANRHTKEGVVTFTARRQGDRVCFLVADTGEGIDSDILPHVFNRSFSGDGSTGLGLFVCKEAVENHGGTIDIQSVPGFGTRIIFCLPISQ